MSNYKRNKQRKINKALGAVQALRKARADTSVSYFKLKGFQSRFNEENAAALQEAKEEEKRIRYQKSQMDWDMLKETRCPKCECVLEDRGTLYFCRHPEYNGFINPFKISKDKFNRIIA